MTEVRFNAIPPIHRSSELRHRFDLETLTSDTLPAAAQHGKVSLTGKILFRFATISIPKVCEVDSSVV